MTDWDKKMAWMFVKPEGLPYENSVFLPFLYEHNFTVMRRSVSVRLEPDQVRRLYRPDKVTNPKWDVEPYVKYMTSGDIRVLFLHYMFEIDDAQKMLRRLNGGMYPLKETKDTLRRRFGIAVSRDHGVLKKGNFQLNGDHVPLKIEIADAENRIIFGEGIGIMEYLSLPEQPQK